MKDYKTFKIDGLEAEFRFKKISPVKILSLSTELGKQNLVSNEEVFTIILENTEVNILGQWAPVKEKDKEVYWPANIEENPSMLQDIITKFIRTVLLPVFQKSSK